MQSSRMKLFSIQGWNMNDNHGKGSLSAWNEWKDSAYAGDPYNEWLEGGHSSKYGSSYTPWTDYIEIQWNRRWLEPGQFVVYMPYNEDAFVRGVFVRLEDRPETGIITKREIATKKEGTFLTLSGYFAEGLLKYGQRVRQLSNITGNNFKYRIARFVAELLTSSWAGNRTFYDILHNSDTSTDVLTEEGKLGTSEIYPILFHTEVGPIRNSSIDFTQTPYSVSDMEYDTKCKDACEWLYSVLPVGVSIRTKVYTRSDYIKYEQQPLCDNALQYPIGSSGYLGDRYVCERKRLYDNIKTATTPMMAASFEFAQGHERHGEVFSVENGNVSNISLSIDETGCRTVSRAHLDSDIGWWTTQYPVTRGLMFRGDDGSYKYRAEAGYYNRGNIPGRYMPNKSYNKWGGQWNFGEFFSVDDIDANTTVEISRDNAQLIRSEIKSQARENAYSSKNMAEETVEMDIIQTDTWQYIRDYDIGDTVGIEFLTTDSTYKARIVEVDEVHHSNQCDVKIRTDNPRNIGWRIGQW